MRETESGNESSDPAMDCIIALEEQRLGRCLNSREIDAVVRRFARDHRVALDPSDNPEKATADHSLRRR
jgi:hypothetical protein